MTGRRGLVALAVGAAGFAVALVGIPWLPGWAFGVALVIGVVGVGSGAGALDGLDEVRPLRWGRR